MSKYGVLLLAYGTPDGLDEVESYLKHILGGRQPKQEMVDDLKRRYTKIGGRSPLLEITKQQAVAVEQALKEGGYDVKVLFGMKHSLPTIPEAISDLKQISPEAVVALPLVPFYSKISVSQYEEAVVEAMNQDGVTFPLTYVKEWYDSQLLLEAWSERIRTAMENFPAGDRGEPIVLFTAHSLPKRILEWDDPYPKQLEDLCRRLSDHLELSDWKLSYQSASSTGEEWLEPDMSQTLRLCQTEGHHNVLVVPIGFISDHLEILYDIDIACMQTATSMGLTLRRTESLNVSSLLIDALAEIIRNNLPIKQSS